ncbi:MAG: cell division protein FtsL [Terriglobia bacterium]
MTEIYIVKHIDNSRLKKEVDYRRTKECFVLMSLGVFCLLILLFLAWQHFEILKGGYENESFKKEVSRLEEDNHKLKLERASLRSPQRIDLIARRDLGLVPPQTSQIVVLPTALPTDLPVTQVASTQKVPVGTGLLR